MDIGPSVEGPGSNTAAGVTNAVDAGLPHVAFNYYAVTVGRVTTMDQMTAAALGSGSEDQYLDLFQFFADEHQDGGHAGQTPGRCQCHPL